MTVSGWPNSHNLAGPRFFSRHIHYPKQLTLNDALESSAEGVFKQKQGPSILLPGLGAMFYQYVESTGEQALHVENMRKNASNRLKVGM